VLVEVYALEGAATAGWLNNLAIRARSGPGDRTLIVGLVLQGTLSRSVLMRGLGPALRPFGLSDGVPDPRLAVFDRNAQVIGSDDNWSATSGLARTFANVGAFAFPAASADSAVFLSLASGSYTVQVTDPDDRSGTSLLELYLAP